MNFYGESDFKMINTDISKALVCMCVSDTSDFEISSNPKITGKTFIDLSWS